MPGPIELRSARVRLAVTGGIAEGKSTVVAELERLGLRAVSADTVAKEVMEVPEILAEVARASGLATPLDREALRLNLASDPRSRRAVNAIVHGETARRLLSADADVAEVPLLIEACLQWAFQRVWVVTCGPVEQRKRMVARCGDEVLADRLIATQLPTTTKLAFADAILRTDREPSTVFEEVRRTAKAHGLVPSQR
ncbi:MAG: dephospho-CoA kinase [Fimbriimonadaceae bacterium]|nr:dephospho-CoA kinase [Fimbriimonadaceae bacterium]QYK58533.1 MAG: dephospho-CoA kinase [Fimbriimonadaceae bacterium]